MNARHGLCGVVLGASLLVGVAVTGTGCDRNDMPKANTNKPVPPPTAQDVAQRAAEAEAKARAAAGAPPRDAAASAKDAAANTAANAKDAVSNAVNDAKASDAAQSAKATADDVMAKVKADGQTLLDKLDNAIKSNKLDEGQTYVDAFDKIKDKVPAELKAKYDTLKAQFAAAKAKAAEPNK